MKHALSIALIALLLAAASPFHRPSEITPVVGAEGTNASIFFWQQAVDDRYDDAVMLVVHGATGENGMWYAYPDFEPPLPMYELVARVKRMHPGRRIVLIACNPDGLAFHAPGVTYALENVWFWPDHNVATDLDAAVEALGYPGASGSIWEFVEND